MELLREAREGHRLPDTWGNLRWNVYRGATKPQLHRGTATSMRFQHYRAYTFRMLQLLLLIIALSLS